MTNGNGGARSIVREVMLPMLPYFLGALVACLLAWGDLKGDLKAFRTEFQVRMANAEDRLDQLDDRGTTRTTRRRTH